MVYHNAPTDIMSLSQEIPSIPSAASTATNGAGVDMQGWDGVLFVLNLGATDGTVDMKAQGDDNSSFSSATDITGAAITQISATGDNRLSAISVWRPTERFVRAVVTTGAGAVADELGVLAIRFRRTGRTPITQHATLAEVIKVAQN
jgi:hypothetical protein